MGNAHGFNRSPFQFSSVGGQGGTMSVTKTGGRVFFPAPLYKILDGTDGDLHTQHTQLFCDWIYFKTKIVTCIVATYTTNETFFVVLGFYFFASASVACRRKRSEQLKGEQKPQGFYAGGLGELPPTSSKRNGLCPDVCLARPYH